jgi:tRNA pseudouridine55 synthase
MVERPAKPVTIYSLEVTDFEDSFFTIKVRCSKGTYIRALARDLGELISCGGHLCSLTRTKIGSYTIENAMTFEQFKELL